MQKKLRGVLFSYFTPCKLHFKTTKQMIYKQKILCMSIERVNSRHGNSVYTTNKNNSGGTEQCRHCNTTQKKWLSRICQMIGHNLND